MDSAVSRIDPAYHAGRRADHRKTDGRLQRLLSSINNAAPIERISVQITDKALVVSYGFRLGLAVGIVFLMTTQPQLAPSLVVLGIASVAGVVLFAGFTRDFRMRRAE
jgi:hypothetical protein